MTLNVGRPPWPATPAGEALAARAQAIYGELGMTLKLDQSGGASDGNFTAAAGIPTLDGLATISGAVAHRRRLSRTCPRRRRGCTCSPDSSWTSAPSRTEPADRPRRPHAVIHVVSFIVAKPGKDEEVKSHLLTLLTPSRRDPGCISYDLHQDADDPRVFVFYETWESREYLNAHLDTPHLAPGRPRLRNSWSPGTCGC